MEWINREAARVFGGFLTNKIPKKKLKESDIIGSWVPNGNGGSYLWFDSDGRSGFGCFICDGEGSTGYFNFIEDTQIIRIKFKYIPWLDEEGKEKG